jgi:hypothetical protein
LAIGAAGRAAIPATGGAGFRGVEHFRGLSAGFFFGHCRGIHSFVSFGLFLLFCFRH